MLFQEHPSGPNLRYNVSWTPAKPIPASLPSTAISDLFDNFETVEEPTLVLALAAIPLFQPSQSKGNLKRTIDNILSGDECQSIAVSVRPFNDLGSGPLGTDTVIQLTRDGNDFIINIWAKKFTVM